MGFHEIVLLTSSLQHIESFEKYFEITKGYRLPIHAFLDLCGFDVRNFPLNAVDNSVLFSSPLVLISNFNLRGFCLRGLFFYPHINSVNRGMPVMLPEKDFDPIEELV